MAAKIEFQSSYQVLTESTSTGKQILGHYASWDAATMAVDRVMQSSAEKLLSVLEAWIEPCATNQINHIVRKQCTSTECDSHIKNLLKIEAASRSSSG
jgi:hypothetical protein